jgi:uncharacterized repeat protein (TIGR04052 family)
MTRHLFLLAAAAGLLTACGGGSETTAPHGFPGGAVHLDFGAVSGTLPVDCTTSSIPALGTTSRTAVLQDLRFYVANVRFVRADGSEEPVTLDTNPWNARLGSDRVTLIDLENGAAACSLATASTPATNARVSGMLAAGDYVAVRFTLGVPESMSHLNPDDPATPGVLAVAAMTRGRTAGRIFGRVEIADPRQAGAPPWSSPVFRLLLGSDGCTGDPATGPFACARPNRATVTVGSQAAPFDVTRQRVALDLAALFVGNDVTVNTSAAPGCASSMMDVECAPIFHALRVHAIDGLPIDGGTGQTVFRAVLR